MRYVFALLALLICFCCVMADPCHHQHKAAAAWAWSSATATQQVAQPAVKPVAPAVVDKPVQSGTVTYAETAGSCANGQCGGSSSGRGLFNVFRRR